MFKRLFKRENLRGYQLVVHGYFFSCLVFFLVQFKGKELTADTISPQFAVLQTFVASLVGTAFAEMAALPFYYPYDLVKVRMQTSQAKYGYRNFVDGLFKLYNQGGSGIKRIRNFYAGAFYYGLAYTLFVSLEFAIHDMLIETIAEFTGSRSASLIHFLRVLEVDEKEGHASHWHNELIASFTAGCVGAFLTNGIETVAVNK